MRYFHRDFDCYQVTYYGVVNSWQDASSRARLINQTQTDEVQCQGAVKTRKAPGLAVKSLRL